MASITHTYSGSSPLYSERVYGEVRPVATYTLTGAWANATGYNLTIPVTGKYRIRMSGNIRTYDNATNSYSYFRLYNQTLTAEVTGSARRYGVAVGNSTSIDVHQPIAGDWEETFTAGQVINLQCYGNSSVGSQLAYVAGTAENVFSYELIERVVSVRNISEDYSTTETDTGKNWIDGKRIYRKVVNTGQMPNAGTKNVAHGASPDVMIQIYGVCYNATNYIPMNYVDGTYRVSTYANGTNIVIVTNVDMTAWTESYVVMEYTK